VVVVGGPNWRPRNPRWRTAAMLKKKVKSPYLCNRLTDFDEIWHDDAYWSPTADRPLKFWIFWKFKMVAAAILKITKIAISLQRFDRSLRNLVCWCKMGLLTAPTVKMSNFTNPKWRTAAIFKTVKSPYLCNRLTDFDEIWYSDAYWPHAADLPLKFRIFENPKCRRPPSWKITKIAISP